MKDQMVAVDQAANIGIQFQGKRPSGPALSSSGRYQRSARRRMRQAKPAMLTEVDMRASMSKSWAATAAIVRVAVPQELSIRNLLNRYTAKHGIIHQVLLDKTVVRGPTHLGRFRLNPPVIQIR
jgi:hypothetical protein